MSQLAVINTQEKEPTVQVFHGRQRVIQKTFGRMLDAEEIEAMRFDPVQFLASLEEPEEEPEIPMQSIELAEFHDNQKGFTRDH